MQLSTAASEGHPTESDNQVCRGKRATAVATVKKMPAERRDRRTRPRSSFWHNGELSFTETRSALLLPVLRVLESSRKNICAAKLGARAEGRLRVVLAVLQRNGPPGQKHRGLQYC